MKHFAFPDAIVLKVHGPDARRYLNARLSNDISQLTATTAIDAAALTPQGKTEAYFTVFQIDESYTLYCTGGDADTVVTAFKRFLVADQVTVETVSENYSLFHLSGEPAELASFTGVKGALKTMELFQQESAAIVINSRLGNAGADVLIPSYEQSSFEASLLTAGSSPLSESQYEQQRIRAGSISFPQEIRDSLLFAEAELNHAVSFSKGCYVGQESLEMLAARGKLPAVIVRVATSGEDTSLVGQSLYEDPDAKQRVATILSSTTDQSSAKNYCFARIKAAKATLKTVYTQSGQACTVTARTDFSPVS